MKKNINLKIKDSRVLFRNVKTSEKYYLYIEYGSKCFYFSNKKKAERFLTKFKKEATELYDELSSYISKLYELSILAIPIADQVKLKKFRKSLDSLLDRYHNVKIGLIMGDINIGREINNLYEAISIQYEFYRKTLRTSNRQRFKYEEVRLSIKNIIRLRKELDYLLYDADGIFKTTKTSENIAFELYLRIA